MTTEWPIERLLVPASLESADADDFHAASELSNLVAGLAWGNNDHWVSAQVHHAAAQPNDYERRLDLVVKDGARIVGRAVIELPLTDNLSVGYVDVLVHPHYLRQGIGTALYRAAESVVQGQGRRILMGWSDHPADFDPTASGVLRPRTGTGALPCQGPIAGFLLSCGFELEQVDRLSVLNLPRDPAALVKMDSDALHAADGSYQLISWQDRCPDKWREQYAHLRQRMSVDIPMGALEWEEEHWDDARLRNGEERLLAQGGRSIVAAVHYVPDNALVGHTILEYYPEKPEVVYQEDTLILAGHRGHRLGMLLKANNLSRLQQIWPQGRRLYTWNAEENEHMLDINVKLGFAPAGYTGAWQKKLGRASPPTAPRPR